MSYDLTRKKFLLGAGACIFLPTLESLAHKAFASSKKPPQPPKRAIFLGFGWGVTEETWYPDKKKTGSNFILPPGLEPLSEHKKDITIVQGCHHNYVSEAHWGSTFWLTGANRFGVPGQSFSNTISVDQVIAKKLGADTRFSSLQLAKNKDEQSGHGPGLSLAWNQGGKPVAALDSPVQVYHRLFSDDTMPLAQRKALLKQKRSVLDTVLSDAKHLKHKLGKTDVDKLDEYFQSVREIEIQLNKNEKWMEVPKKKSPIPQPKNNLKGYDEIKVMYDLMVAAFQTDNTRVITYRQPVASLLQSLSIKTAPHDMSHYTKGPRMESSQKRDTAQSELLAHLITKLKSVKEVDGSSLFDHVSLAYGSNIRSIHYLNNCPTLLSGGGAGIKLGHHLVEEKDTPLNNVWLTLLHGLGIKAPSHGDSTGTLKSLQA